MWLTLYVFAWTLARLEDRPISSFAHKTRRRKPQETKQTAPGWNVRGHFSPWDKMSGGHFILLHRFSFVVVVRDQATDKLYVNCIGLFLGGKSSQRAAGEKIYVLFSQPGESPTLSQAGGSDKKRKSTISRTRQKTKENFPGKAETRNIS